MEMMSSIICAPCRAAAWRKLSRYDGHAITAAEIFSCVGHQLPDKKTGAHKAPVSITPNKAD